MKIEKRIAAATLAFLLALPSGLLPRWGIKREWLQQAYPEIDHYGERLIGCIECKSLDVTRKQAAD